MVLTRKQQNSDHLGTWVWAQIGRRRKSGFPWMGAWMDPRWPATPHARSQRFERSAGLPLVTPPSLTGRVALCGHRTTTSMTAVPDRKVKTLTWRFARFSDSQATGSDRRETWGQGEEVGGADRPTKLGWSVGADTFRANCALHPDLWLPKKHRVQPCWG